MPLFARGLIIGLAIAAPVGAIGVLCIRRTLAHGRAVGLATGLGAATADSLYGAAAAFGLSVVTSFLTAQAAWLRLAGGAFLLWLGWRTFRAVPREFGTDASQGVWSAYASTFGLTLTNPTTIFAFAAVFAGFGFRSTGVRPLEAASLVLGVFLGSAAWWLFLSGVVGAFRERVGIGAMRWVNRASGATIMAFGAVALGAGLRILG